METTKWFQRWWGSPDPSPEELTTVTSQLDLFGVTPGTSDERNEFSGRKFDASSNPASPWVHGLF